MRFRPFLIPVLASAVSLAVISGALPRAEGRPRATEIRAVFSPQGGAMETVAKEIRGARRTLDAALYMITSTTLSDELVMAHKRGVKVRIVLDGGMTRRFSKLDDLLEGEVPVWLVALEPGEDDHSPPQFHHKFAVIDGEKVLTGSLNWTVAGDERNHENLLVIHDRDLAAEFTAALERGLALGERQ